MIAEHILRLEFHWDKLVEEISNPNNVIHRLHMVHILNEVEVIALRKEVLPSEKVTKLLNILVNKSDRAWVELSNALNEDNQDKWNDFCK